MIRNVVALTIASLALFFLALAVGDHPVSWMQMVYVLCGSSAADAQSVLIVREIRLPRILLGFLVGAALGIGGTIAQTVLRNPLAEPGLIGINAGAAFAAVIVLVKFEVPPTHLLSGLAFAGALAMSFVIYVLSWNSGTSSFRIILIGVGLSSLAWAGANFISAFGDPPAVQRAMVWLAGSVYHSSWEKIRTLLVWLLVAAVGCALTWRELELVAFGEETARGRGQPVESIRALMMVLCALVSGAAVAAAGLVAFVGLIAPHVARSLVGNSHRRVLPIAALSGGLLVVAADLVGRSLFGAAQIPVGLMTAMLGAPFFGYLMWVRRNA